VRTLKIALALAAIGVVLSLWLLVQVTWASFVAFMVVAQPLLLVAVLLFAVAAVKELRQGDTR
jgi:hypothetical protein